MEIVVQFLVSLGIAIIGYQMVSQLERNDNYYPKDGRRRIGALLAVLYLFVAAVGDVMAGAEGTYLRSLLWGSLALAAYCDYCTTEIYDIVYLPALIVGIMLAVVTPGIKWLELFIFLFVQWTLFYRLFGISDCIAFSICALWLALDGGKLFDFSMLMMLAWVSLAVVQLCRRNINRKGNLKVEVAMIPYIAISMLMLTIYKR